MRQGNRDLRWLSFGLTIVTIAAVSACAVVPQGSVVLLGVPPASELRNAVATLPPTWDGRLLRVGDKPPALGGEATHVHDFSHQHKAESQDASPAVRPYGLKMTFASATHHHKLLSRSQTPSVTGPADNLPRAKELLGYVLRKSLRHVEPGIIIAYLESDVPQGFYVCDGGHGTPDLRGLYVVVKTATASPDIVGQGQHDHDARHNHDWNKSSQPNPERGADYGLANDQTPPVTPNAWVSPLLHDHRVADKVVAEVRTDAASVLPPSVRVRFLMASAAARDMPRGAVIPFMGDSPPHGWAWWQVHNAQPVLERFLLGESDSGQVGTLVGQATHVHHLHHTHKLQLQKTEAEKQGIRSHDGPLLSTGDHGHAVLVEDTVTTQPAAALPRFVSLRFIRKE